jgi:hypothetical protein
MIGIGPIELMIMAVVAAGAIVFGVIWFAKRQKS